MALQPSAITYSASQARARCCAPLATAGWQLPHINCLYAVGLACQRGGCRTGIQLSLFGDLWQPAKASWSKEANSQRTCRAITRHLSCLWIECGSAAAGIGVMEASDDEAVARFMAATGSSAQQAEFFLEASGSYAAAVQMYYGEIWRPLRHIWLQCSCSIWAAVLHTLQRSTA